MTAESLSNDDWDHAAAVLEAGDTVALRTLNGKRHYYYVLSGEVRTGEQTTIWIRDGWRWDVGDSRTRRIPALERADRRTAVISDNRATLTECRHSDSEFCRCRFGVIQAVERGEIVDPYAVVPSHPPEQGGKYCGRESLWGEA